MPTALSSPPLPGTRFQTRRRGTNVWDRPAGMPNSVRPAQSKTWHRLSDESIRSGERSRVVSESTHGRPRRQPARTPSALTHLARCHRWGGWLRRPRAAAGRRASSCAWFSLSSSGNGRSSWTTLVSENPLPRTSLFVAKRRWRLSSVGPEPSDSVIERARRLVPASCQTRPFPTETGRAVLPSWCSAGWRITLRASSLLWTARSAHVP